MSNGGSGSTRGLAIRYLHMHVQLMRHPSNVLVIFSVLCVRHLANRCGGHSGILMSANGELHGKASNERQQQLGFAGQMGGE